MDTKKAGTFLVIILAISFMIRLPGIFQTVSIDEDGWLSWDYWGNWHPPISILANSLARSMLGDFSWASKLLILFVATLNLALTYLLAKKLSGEKAALFAAGLMGIGAYPTLAALQIDIDGSFLLFGYLLTTLFYLNYLDGKELKWLILSGIGVGLCVLTKYPGVFILPILALYHLASQRDLYGAAKASFALLAIGALVFSIFPLWSCLAQSSFFTDTLAHFSKYTSDRSINLWLLLVQYLLSVIWMGPLFIGLLVLSLKKPRRSNLLPYIWIGMIFLAYTLINKDNFKPIERYFTIMVAPLAMIGGGLLSRLKLERRHLAAIAGASALFLVIFAFLNLSGSFIPFYPKTGFIEKALSLSWDFYLPISGSSGPIGFFLNFRIIAFSFILAAALLPLLMVLRGSENGFRAKGLQAIALILFLSVSMAYNIFVVQEFLFSTTSPSVDKVSKEIILYAHENELKEPVYIFRNKALRYYLKDITVPVIIDFGIENNSTKVDEIISKSGTLIIVDFPKLNENSLFWQKVMECSHVADFSDKGFLMGYILDCSKINSEVTER